MSIELLAPTFESWVGRSSDREIAVLMSGGVDSSVTAIRLLEAGWRVLGLTMEIPVPETGSSQPAPCCGSDAAVVCCHLDIPHYFLDISDLFEKHVIDHFRRAYIEGRTPNPCVNCNTFLKFKAVWGLIEREFGIRHLATGHYARVIRTDAGTYLSRAPDRDRDQSYFIYGIPPERLPFLELPMGEMDSKQEVREVAEKSDLPVADKPDSMELCFAGEGDYRELLKESRRGGGPILDVRGNELGQHAGVWNYTVGQRRGLGIAAGEPLYVIRIEPEDNSIIVGTRGEASCRTVRAKELNVLIPDLLSLERNLFGKIRSYNKEAPCRVTELDNARLTVKFDAPQFAPAPGQHLVLYDKDGRIVAGGEIEPTLVPTFQDGQAGRTDT